jgi:hypothetical protein
MPPALCRRYVVCRPYRNVPQPDAPVLKCTEARGWRVDDAARWQRSVGSRASGRRCAESTTFAGAADLIVAAQSPTAALRGMRSIPPREHSRSDRHKAAELNIRCRAHSPRARGWKASTGASALCARSDRKLSFRVNCRLVRSCPFVAVGLRRTAFWFGWTPSQKTPRNMPHMDRAGVKRERTPGRRSAVQRVAVKCQSTFRTRRGGSTLQRSRGAYVTGRCSVAYSRSASGRLCSALWPDRSGVPARPAEFRESLPPSHIRRALRTGLHARGS